MNIKANFRRFFKSRPPVSHKGDFGRLLILAGSKGLSGACVLASSAALRTGAGLVTVGVPNSLVLPLAKRLTEAMVRGFPETRDGTLSKRALRHINKFLKKQNVLAVGPGLSAHPETKMVVQKILLASRIPLVIDADGLNALRGKTTLLKRLKAAVVLTPHAGEFVRLFSGRLSNSDVQRKKRAEETAKEYGVVLVLKGHHTVVASPRQTYVNKTGNPGMATGGSGDVLTGIISAILAQGATAFEAACFGVYLHGLAGDLAKKDKGEFALIAGDIIERIPQAFKKVLRNR